MQFTRGCLGSSWLGVLIPHLALLATLGRGEGVRGGVRLAREEAAFGCVGCGYTCWVCMCISVCGSCVLFDLCAFLVIAVRGLLMESAAFLMDLVT